MDSECLPPPKRQRRGGEAHEGVEEGNENEDDEDDQDGEEQDEGHEEDEPVERPSRARAKAKAKSAPKAKAKAKARTRPAGKAKAKARGRPAVERVDPELLKRKSKAYHRARATAKLNGLDDNDAREAGRKACSHTWCVKNV